MGKGYSPLSMDDWAKLQRANVVSRAFPRGMVVPAGGGQQDTTPIPTPVPPTPTPTPTQTSSPTPTPSITPTLTSSPTPTPTLTPTPTITPSATPSNVGGQNLVLFLDSGNATSYPGSGTAWNDISGFARNWSLQNGPVFSGDNGGIIYFDGVDDGAVRGNDDGFQFSTAGFAIEVWVRIKGNSAQNNNGIREAALFSVFPNSGNIQSSFTFVLKGSASNTGDGLLFQATNNIGTTQNRDINFSFDKNELYQVGFTRIGGVSKFFINGITYSVSNLTTNMTIFTRQTRIGFLGYSGFLEHLNGGINIVRVYKNVGLTDAQILQNYNFNSNRI